MADSEEPSGHNTFENDGDLPATTNEPVVHKAAFRFMRDGFQIDCRPKQDVSPLATTRTSARRHYISQVAQPRVVPTIYPFLLNVTRRETLVESRKEK